ncbi:fimbria/pilus outer membrane usher protein [Vibrio sp. V01_P9A10T6]|uniref:fimbria/pilus outer membrane usher protein n=1 Tax=Vibrio sp. V01_P9A10T6 TaxID=2116368 RepID=UPI000D027FC3|nr:fimbria/pilus outer membrane usher protein [Vibrio sp. V01_P9A10T6]PRQ63539.1 fimbrial assembly protein [Vibrio sp. V01_P9A10T6]
MKKNLLSVIFYLFFIIWINITYASEIEFNTDLLDIEDKETIESGVFGKPGYIIPGDYTMQVVVNNTLIGERNVHFYDQKDKDSQLCLTASLANDLGLKTSELKHLLSSPTIATQKDSVCYNPKVLKGIVIKGEVNKDTLTISIPQVYRDYVNQYWEPASYWDNGVNGALLDYGINVQDVNSTSIKRTNLSSYGVAGINIDAWRLRADWQGHYQHEDKQGIENVESDFNINHVYTYRSLPDFNTKLMLGELDLNDSLFDSFKFTGVSLNTDDNLLPPNLRGYAPEIVGIAKTDAKVVITSSGRVIYETQVAAGPFRIQDLSSSISGTLDVRVEEQDGSVQSFQVNTATIPYLSRPGSLRYKFNSGKASSEVHELDGPAFASAEFSWGVNNGWSLLGGGLFADGYSALSVGVGRDLLQFGAISFDITESRAQLSEETKSGGSYRINYSKIFESYDSQVAFAGYRFSDRDFMNMNKFMESKQIDRPYFGESKEIYSILLSKQFKGEHLAAYMDYSHQSYWHDVDSDRLSLSLSKEFSIMDWSELNASLSAYHNKQNSRADNGVYLNISIPLGGNKSISYRSSSSGGEMGHSISLHSQLDERSSYSLTASTSSNGENVSGFYTYNGDKTTATANVSHTTEGSTAIGLSLRGGITATSKGAAIHRTTTIGGSRIMVDTDGESGVPVHAGGLDTFTDKNGKAVLTDVASSYRQRVSIDVDRLGEDIDPIGTPVSIGTLSEGAIGYRHFDMLSGSRRMFELFRSDGKHVLFASEVFNDKGQLLGMVGEGGMTYLVGLHEDEMVNVVRDNAQYCRLQLPSPLPDSDTIGKLSCQ